MDSLRDAAGSPQGQHADLAVHLPMDGPADSGGLTRPWSARNPMHVRAYVRGFFPRDSLQKKGLFPPRLPRLCHAYATPTRMLSWYLESHTKTPLAPRGTSILKIVKIGTFPIAPSESLRLSRGTRYKAAMTHFLKVGTRGTGVAQAGQDRVVTALRSSAPFSPANRPCTCNR